MPTKQKCICTFFFSKIQTNGCQLIGNEIQLFDDLIWMIIFSFFHFFHFSSMCSFFRLLKEKEMKSFPMFILFHLSFIFNSMIWFSNWNVSFQFFFSSTFFFKKLIDQEENIKRIYAINHWLICNDVNIFFVSNIFQTQR